MLRHLRVDTSQALPLSAPQEPAARRRARHMCKLMATSSLILLTACNSISATGFGSQPEVPLAQQKASQDLATGSGILNLARDLEERGDLAGALPLYRHLAGQGSGPGALGLARVLLATGSSDEALLAAKKAMDEDSSLAPQASYISGRSYLALGQYSEALSAFERANGIDGAVRGKGVALAALGDTRRALTAFQSDNTTAGRANAALIMALTGDTKTAVTAMEALVQGGDAGPQERQILSMAYLADQQSQKAFEIARLDLDPQAARDTLTFYRTVLALPEQQRMRAMITGTVAPGIDREEDGNLILPDRDSDKAAAERLVAAYNAPQPEPEPVPAIVAEPEPAPEPKAEPAFIPSPRPHIPDDAPALLGPEGYALQIGAYRTIERLVRGWTLLREANLDILGDIEPRRSEIDFGVRDSKPNGFYFRLNAGPLKDLAEARRLCRLLRERGTACWVRPPEVDEGELPNS